MSQRTPALHRLRSIRASLLLLALVPSVALSGLWAATTESLLSRGLDLRAQATINLEAAEPFGAMIGAVAAERALSAVWLADEEASHADLEAQRAKTDVAAGLMAQLDDKLKDAPPKSKEAFQPVVDTVQELDLANLRAQIDNRSIDTQTAIAAFTRVVDAEMVGTDRAFELNDASLLIVSTPIRTLLHAREQIQLENATLAPAVASGELSPKARAAFVHAVGARRQLMATVPHQLGAHDRAAVERLTQSQAWQTMEAIEDAIVAGPGDDSTALPALATKWPGTFAEVSPRMTKVTEDPIFAYIAQTGARSEALVREGLILSGAGLVAVLVVALLSWRVTRSLLQRMAGLRRATLELAETRLPSLIDRLNQGESVNVESEVTDLDYGDDELGKVAHAFNSAQRTALRSAVGLADARRGFQNAILSVARHTQNLVNRQLSLLDTLEREHQEPDVLKGLYELDSQASQMRRYEENLVIISGGQPGRRWSEPVTIIDVIRSAVGEVADYKRITVHADEQQMLAAYAVADVIHLLAELMENATNYSPPVCPVLVRSEHVGKGLAIEIEDRGLGMSDEEYAEANRRLSGPPPFDLLALASDIRLGLFVVAQLAAQHGIQITLRSSPFGGTSAVVLLPSPLLIQNSPTKVAEVAEVAADTGIWAALADTEAQPDVHPDPYRDEQPAPAPLSVFTPLRSTTAPASSPLGAKEPPARTPGAASLLTADDPPLPQRVPQASLAEELRRDPTRADVVPPDPEPLPEAEQVAWTMSAFQRGTAHARDFGTHSAHDRNSTAMTEDPR